MKTKMPIALISDCGLRCIMSTNRNNTTANTTAIVSNLKMKEYLKQSVIHAVWIELFVGCPLTFLVLSFRIQKLVLNCIIYNVRSIHNPHFTPVIMYLCITQK